MSTFPASLPDSPEDTHWSHQQTVPGGKSEKKREVLSGEREEGIMHESQPKQLLFRAKVNEE